MSMHPDAIITATLVPALTRNMLELANSSPPGSHTPMGFFHETSDSCSAFKAPCSLNSTIHQRCGDGKKDAWAHLGISFSNSLTCFDTVEHGTTSHYWAIQYAISARIPDFLATSNAPGRDSILRVITLV